ncbi:MAG TPA: hypothetical protein VMZ53_11330 [Kofleriaceae bacterium]|nr:hypothetical protein [Kofleriaceae bacterium]
MLRKRGNAWEDEHKLDKEIDDDMRDVATKSGIADVDPVPLSHVAGEGIDPDGDVNAHEEIREQRDRLPDRRYR